MKTICLLLLISLKLSAQKKELYDSPYELRPDTILIFGEEKFKQEYEGNEITWHSDYSKKLMRKIAILQFPYFIIYFPVAENISMVNVCNRIPVQFLSNIFIILPGEYRMHKNEDYHYIICKTYFIAASDSSLVQSKHVYFRPG